MTVVGTLDELIQKLDTQRQIGNRLVPAVHEFEIDFDIDIPINLANYESRFPAGAKDALEFKSCKFSKTVNFKSNAVKLYIYDCHFEETNWNDVTFQNKVRMQSCHFHKPLILNNTVFEDLVDFWDTKFYEKVVFYKTDFEATVVFSLATFKQNLLFTYTRFARQVLLRGTVIEKGIDLSLAIIDGTLSIFDFKVPDFPALIENQTRLEYEVSVSEDGDIPIKNKRETLRIIRKAFEGNSDYINSLNYKKLELKTFDKILDYNIKISQDKWSNKFNRVILWLNRKSNDYGTRFEYGVLFTFRVGLIFFILIFLSTEEFWNRICLNCEIDLDVIAYTIKQFINYLNPVHSMDFIDEVRPIFGISYIFDFFGRIAVGYGIYQTVQAFRKYR
tara:strand:- start:5479 stop:6645 length:1167 start_codon:yes stop_codon:yes gene_type:complete